MFVVSFALMLNSKSKSLQNTFTFLVKNNTMKGQKTFKKKKDLAHNL